MNLDVEQCREWFSNQIREIKEIQNKKHRLILLLSLADAFAQSHGDYGQNSNRRYFASFLLQFSSEQEYSAILRSICPVTLYYDKNDEYQFGKLNLTSSRVYLANSNDVLQEAKRLKDCIPEDKRDIIVRRHRYAELIYAMRNKLVHEMVDIGLDINFQESKAHQIPHMVHGVAENEGGIRTEYWKLHIPEVFIFCVVENAVNEYLTWCANNQKTPFKNNLHSRKCYFAWYDN